MSAKEMMVNALEIVAAEASLGDELDAVHATNFVTCAFVDEEGASPEFREVARKYKVQLEKLTRALCDLEDLEIGSIVKFQRSVDEIIEEVRSVA